MHNTDLPSPAALTGKLCQLPNLVKCELEDAILARLVSQELPVALATSGEKKSVPR